jgi:hypothetical protein
METLWDILEPLTLYGATFLSLTYISSLRQKVHPHVIHFQLLAFCICMQIIRWDN